MTRHPLLSAPRGLFVGLDVLLLALVVVAVVQAPAGRVLVTGLLAAVLLGVYAWGRAVVRVQDRAVDAPRGAWWPDTAWVVGLLVPWAVLLWLTPGALWVAFPLMLLQMHALGPHRGVVTVVVTTALAVAAGLAGRDAGDSWTGFVLGPVLGAAVAVGVVLGLEALVRESQARQRTVDELTRTRRHLDEAERDRAIATERERLAREIHDTIAQSLSAIELLLRTADAAIGSDDERARGLVHQARGAAADSLGEARRFVRDLAPVDLDRTTLVAALRRVAERTAGASREQGAGAAPLTVTVHTVGDPRPLPVSWEAAVLRIVQQALANVAQHADATRARVTLTYAPDEVTLEVVDDGIGFDPPSPGADRLDRADGGGFGLPAIRSRAHELGGTLALESAPGRGTALAVTLPVPAPEPTS